MGLVRARLALLDPLDRGLIIIAGALLPLSVLLAATPGLSDHILAPHLDLVLDTTALVVTGSVALLLVVRFGERDQPIALLQASAFLLLAGGYAVGLWVSVATEGMTPDALVPHGQQQQQVFAVSRLLAAALLVGGGLASLRGLRMPGTARVRSPAVVLLVPLAVFLAIAVGVQLGALPVPDFITVEAVAPYSEPDAMLTPFGVTMQLGAATLTMAAAFVCRRLWRRDRIIGDAYVSLALVLASVAQLHAAVFPTLHPIQVSSSDALWLAFDITMLLGVEAEARAAMSTIRRAHAELAVLRQAELERAAVEERNRLSRELHDGLAQHLWYVKLKAARLGEALDQDDVRELAADLSDGIDSALADARQAVMALRVGPSGDDSLGSLLRRYVDDFADRFAIRIEVESDRDLPRLAYRTEAELLHVAHEALMNAVRHADASRIQVRLAKSAGMLSLMIADNGRGFDPAQVPGASYGLRGIRERTALMHGSCSIDSRPHDGTRIVVAVPISARAAESPADPAVVPA